MAHALKRRNDVDMTHGSIPGHLIRFAIPLIAGSLFQQLYNMVDTWVVGNFVSNEAFSAVGSVGPIINMLIGFFTGLSNGAGVVISQYYGAKREEEVRKAVHTAIAMTLLMGVAFTVLGIAITPFMLRFMKTPDNVMPESSAYLVIYFGGILGLMLYNMGAGILRAVGDSKRPFYFLVVCAILNVILDLLFVLGFGMGVEGVAWATVLSQAISALLVTFTLLRTEGWVRLRLQQLRLHWDIFKKVLSIGLPAALQFAVTAFSNVFVQSYINYFGADCMSGWTAFNKIDQLLKLPMESIALASTTFVGQNLGSGQPKRAKRSILIASGLAMVCTAVLIVAVIYPFAPQLVAFFNSKEAVVEYGTLFLYWISPFFLLNCINQIFACGLRGAGNTKAPMVMMLCSFVLFRQLYLFIMANYISNTVIPIAMGYPAGWFVASLSVAIYLYFTDFERYSLTKTT